MHRKISRRTFVKYAGSAAAVAGLGWARPVHGAAATPLAVYDLTYVYDYDLTDPQQAAIAYDHMHLVTTLQGIVNRDEPRLYVRFIQGGELDPFNRDDYWLEKLRAPGEWLAARQLEHVRDLDSLIRRFRQHLSGAVVYDPKVWSTSNVASTVAGVEDVLAIRYDPAEGSLYNRYVAHAVDTMQLPVRVWLVNRDGTSKFTGSGIIPDTDLPSTGSAKCDAYWWAKTRYLDTGRCAPTELGYYLDSYWLSRPGDSVQQAVLSNHDYLVSRRGFVFDLFPWDDETPVDDRNQPVGTDRRTFEAILWSAYDQSGGSIVAVHGFVPWAWKYSSFGRSGSSHDPVSSEWQMVKVASAYNACFDADAENLDGMANASVYRHYPLRPSYPQNPRPTVADLKARGFVNADGSVSPRRYAMFYVGDYDSAAWLYRAISQFWDDPNRGAVPLNWAFNPNLGDRMAPALAYTRRTRTSNDFFVAGDTGAGYVNPGMLQAPREFSGLPSGLPAWAEHCERYYRRWDLSITGFIIDGFAPGLNREGLATYQQFSPDGLAAQKIAPLGLSGTMPYTRMDIDLPRDTSEAAAGALKGALDGDTSRAPYAPEFHVFRTILEPPTWHKEVVEKVQGDLPNAAVELVDAYTFYALIRQYLLDQVILTPVRATLSPGKASPVLLEATSYVRERVAGTLSIEAPEGWEVSPGEVAFALEPEETRNLSLDVTVPEGTPYGDDYALTAVARYNGVTRRRRFAASVKRTYDDAQQVDVALGEPNRSDGLEQIELADGQTVSDVVGGRESRRPRFTQWEFSYFYIRVNDTFMYDARDTTAYATVEYFDAPGQELGIHYDSNNPAAPLEGAYTNAGSIQTTGGNTWKSHTFELAGVRFANRQNGESDLRLYTNDDVCVSRVVVSRTQP